jgi:hypothetical protein
MQVLKQVLPAEVVVVVQEPLAVLLEAVLLAAEHMAKVIVVVLAIV